MRTALGPDPSWPWLRTSTYIVVLAGLLGCQSSTGILMRGPDEYFLSVKTAPIRGGSKASRQEAYEMARQHCLKQWKQVVVLQDDSGPVTTDLHFKCVSTKAAGAR